MKQLLFIFIFSLTGNIIFAQSEKLGETFSIIQQIDSSTIFTFESFVTKKESAKYRLSYSRFGANGDPIGRNNVWFYNSSNGKCFKIFNIQPILVAPLMLITRDNYMFNYTNSSRGTFRSSGILSNKIIYNVQNDGYNKDGLLTDDDGYSLFISTTDGQKLTQITPSEFNVAKWMISRDGKTIIATVQKDNNGDKSFIDEAEELFNITLDDDFSKIKLSPIKMGTN